MKKPYLVLSFISFFVASIVLCGMQVAAGVSDPTYEGETWVEEGNPIAIVCKIPMREPYALQWTRNDQPLNLSMVVGLGSFCRLPLSV